MEQMSKEDYIYCEDCKEYVDLFQYGDIDNTGHSEHKWRFVDEEELKVCIHDCLEEGCIGREEHG